MVAKPDVEAIEETLEHPWAEYTTPAIDPGSFRRDQNGAVWFSSTDGGGGFMSAQNYHALLANVPSMMAYEDLPPFDCRIQNIVDVGE